MKLKPLLLVILLTVIGFLVHKILSYFLIPKSFEDNFVYSTLFLYFIFSCSTLLIVFILIQISKKSFDNVGYSFLFLTCLKMVLAYLLLQPILSPIMAKTPTEKMNFFITFVYFLAIETGVTIRILNNKQ
jgi:hypothetical protein